MEITRRSFLTGSALLGATALAGLSGIDPRPAYAATTVEETQTTEHDPQRTEECDIVVVGSGTAGICATVRAAQLGAHVILLEKNGSTGGSSSFAEGVGAVNSYMHDEQGLHFSETEVLENTQSYHHWAADSNVLSHFIRNTGDTINWLHYDCGINFYETTITSPTSYPSWHLLADADGNLTRTGKGLIEPMTTLAGELGADVRLLCPATGLMTDGDTVTGVYYRDHNESGDPEYAIKAKAVILATGGYSRNKEMFERLTHIDFDRLNNYGAFGTTGDGITWATDLGADTHIPSCVMYSCTYVPGTQMFEDKVNWMFSWQPNLRVNQAGVRFMNEQMATDFSIVSNSVLAQTTAYSVIDHGFLEHVENEALPFGLDSVGYHTGEPLPGVIDAVEQGVADGKVFKADTYGELAQAMGLDEDTFTNTVEEYNGYAHDGSDPVFNCPATSMWALDNGPFYAAEIMPSIFTTVGGLRVDEQWRALRPDATPIEGLYALGNDASSQVGHDYDVGVMSGSQQGWCATGGRLVVEGILA